MGVSSVSVGQPGSHSQPRCPFSAAASAPVPLLVTRNTYQTSEDTAALLAEIGGGDAIRKMTTAFYEKVGRNGRPHHLHATMVVTSRVCVGIASCRHLL